MPSPRGRLTTFRVSLVGEGLAPPVQNDVTLFLCGQSRTPVPTNLRSISSCRGDLGTPKTRFAHFREPSPVFARVKTMLHHIKTAGASPRPTNNVERIRHVVLPSPAGEGVNRRLTDEVFGCCVTSFLRVRSKPPPYNKTLFKLSCSDNFLVFPRRVMLVLLKNSVEI